MPEHNWAGFTQTSGGDEGTVYHVTNLNNSGEGSFRYGLEEVIGPRLIVFDVGGVIDLDRQRISLNEGNVTVAGQTAPSPGITFIKGDVRIGNGRNDVIIEHIMGRAGDAGNTSDWEPGCIFTDSAEDVIVRNCSLTWAIDEGLTASGPRDITSSKKVSFINNIIAEGLSNSTHSSGEHSKGSTIINFVQDIAVIGNLYAHNNDRNPRFASDCLGVVVNNLVYNPGLFSTTMTYDSEDPNFSNSQISFVGNYLQKGVDSHNTRPFLWAQATELGDAYVDDNIALRADGSGNSITNSHVIILNDPPVWPTGLIPLPASSVKDHVLQTVGARPWDRDPIDQRIIDTVINKNGQIIDSQDEVGGYPNYTPTSHTLVVPEENRREWLDSFQGGVESGSVGSVSSTGSLSGIAEAPEVLPNEITGGISGAGYIIGVIDRPVIAPNESTGSMSGSGVLSGITDAPVPGEHQVTGLISGTGSLSGVSESPEVIPNEAVGTISSIGAISGIIESPVIAPNESVGALSGVGILSGISSGIIILFPYITFLDSKISKVISTKSSIKINKAKSEIVSMDSENSKITQLITEKSRIEL